MPNHAMSTRFHVVFEALARLQSLGWTAGEVSAANRDGRPAWRVHAHRGQETILGSAMTQVAAWRDVLRQAESLSG